MYCAKCGTEYEDGAAFCPVCGEPSGVEQPAYATEGNAATKTNIFSGLIGKLIIVGAIIAVLLIGFFIFRGSPKAVAKKYIKAEVMGDLKGLQSTLVLDPVEEAEKRWEEIADDRDMTIEEYVEEMCEDEDFDASSVKEYYKEMYKERKEEAKDEIEDLKIEVKSVKKVKKSKLENLRDNIDDSDSYEDIKAKSISAASIVKVKLSAEVDGEDEKETMEVLCVLYKGKWKVISTGTYLLEKADD